MAMEAEPGPGETLDVLMEVIHQQALRMRERSNSGPLDLDELDTCGRLALACARIHRAMHDQIPRRAIAAMTTAELRAKIAELEAS